MDRSTENLLTKIFNEYMKKSPVPVPEEALDAAFGLYLRGAIAYHMVLQLAPEPVAKALFMELETLVQEVQDRTPQKGTIQ